MDPVVILASDDLTVASGETTQVGVRILNRGRRVEAYRIDVVGEAAAFGSVDPATVSILPGREAHVEVTFVAPTGPSASAGTHRFGVRAVSEVDATSAALAEGRLEVAGAGGVHAWFPETVAAGRWSGRFQLHVDNRGNAPVRLAVTAHEPTGDLRVETAPDVVELLPGARSNVMIQAKARRPYLRGTAVSRVVQVATHDCPFGADRPVPGSPVDPDDPHHQQFQLQFEQRPIIGRWVLIVAALLVLGVVALIALRLSGGSEVELEVSRPFAPIDFTAAPLGSDAIALAWLPVPNAVGYEIWPSESDGTTPAGAEELVVEDAVTTYGELQAATVYCFKVRSVGFDDQKSAFTDPRCASTAAVSEIPVPSDVTATGQDPTTIAVEWSYPAEALDQVTHFTLIVDNRELPDQFVVSDGGRQSATATIEASTTERTIKVRVRAETAEGPSEASAEFELSVPALPVPTTPTVTPPTEPGAGGDDGGGGGGGGDSGESSGGAATTTTTTTSTTTMPPDTTTIPTLPPGPISELEPQFQETWAVMLPQITAGGIAADELRNELAAAVGDVPTSVRDFFNRDKFVLESRDPTNPQFDADLLSGVESTLPGLPPSQRWLFLPVIDGDTAVAGCAALAADNPACVSVRIRSAGHPQALVRRLEELDRDTPLAAIDERITELRAGAPDLSIHMLDASVWNEFEGDSWVLFARVTPENQAALCPTENECVQLTAGS